MRLRLLVAALAVLLVALLAGVASARNPHCAGGMQYVTQALRDKEKGNTEDYQREINKAVDQLSECAAEDTVDYEAIGYLGWALAEVDSAGPAGMWFKKAFDTAVSKGDKKKADIIQTNRDHYWTLAFNDGIKAIQDANASADAAKSFATAVQKLTSARALKPGSPQTIRSLATAYAVAKNYDAAEIVLRSGLQDCAGDTTAHVLNEMLSTVRANKAAQFVDAKKYDEAIAYYQDLTQQEPGNSELWRGLGDAYDSRSETKTDAAAKRADKKLAGDAFAKAYAAKPGDSNLAFNAAVSYQNAGDLASAEGQWRAVMKTTPDDPEALSQLGSVLADEKKYDEATKMLLRAVSLKPEEKSYYRQLAASYSKAGNGAKFTEVMYVYLAMNGGKPIADPAGAAKTAKAGTAKANTATSLGAPDKAYDWTDNSVGALQTWIYSAKKLGFTFNGAGALVQKSDWNAK